MNNSQEIISNSHLTKSPVSDEAAKPKSDDVAENIHSADEMQTADFD